MDWQAVALAMVGSVQVILLAWIAAWQQRAAHEVRKLNGSLLPLLEPEPEPRHPLGLHRPR